MSWITNTTAGTVSKFSSYGAALSPSTGYVGMPIAEGIAIDGSRNAWVASASDSGLFELSNAGTMLSPTLGYSGRS